jgi:diacylglycerol kinase (ATP)
VNISLRAVVLHPIVKKKFKEKRHKGMPAGLDAVLIVNTKSRRGKEWFPRAKSALQQDGVTLKQAWELDEPAEVVAKTSEAVAQRIPLVIVGGGDGTLRSVAHCFVGSASTLGVLPLGTGNQFARDLNIPVDVGAACRIITNGKTADVDLGTAGNDYFLTVASVGLSTEIAEQLTDKEKKRFGLFSYALALTHVLRRLKPFRATLTTPEGVQTFETLQVVIGNGRFHAGPFPLAPDATITDGKLTTYVVATTSRLGLLRYMFALIEGRQDELKEVKAFETTEIVLETSPSERVTVDGEHPFSTPLRFGIAPRALRVMVPQDFGRPVPGVGGKD